MNLDYWEDYYREPRNGNPSLFARFCLPYTEPTNSVLDLGCGNGRDSFFFSKKGLNVTGIDGSAQAIKGCESLKNGTLPSFRKLNFADIDKLDIFPDYIYLRFVLCAIDEAEQKKLFSWISSHIKNKGKFFIETRSINDKIVSNDDHTRRFVGKMLLESQIKDLGFTILYSKEKRNFAPIKNGNPLLIRLIGEKK